MKKLNTSDAELFSRKLTEASLTVLKNNNNLLPLRDLENLQIASVSFGSDNSTFQETTNLYANIAQFQLPNDATAEQVSEIKSALKNYNMVIAAVYDASKFTRNNLEASMEAQGFLPELANKKNKVVTFFKNPF